MDIKEIDLFDTAASRIRRLRFENAEVERWFKIDRSRNAILQSRISLCFVAVVFSLDGGANIALGEHWFALGYAIALVLLLMVFSLSWIPSVMRNPRIWDLGLVTGASAIAVSMALINVNGLTSSDTSFLGEATPYFSLYVFGLAVLFRMRALQVGMMSVFVALALATSSIYLVRTGAAVPAVIPNDVKLIVVLMIAMGIATFTAYWIEREERRAWHLSHSRYLDLISIYPERSAVSLYRTNRYPNPVSEENAMVVLLEIVESNVKMAAVSAKEWFDYFNGMLMDWDEVIREANAYRLRTTGDGVVVIAGIEGTTSAVEDILHLALQLRNVSSSHTLKGEVLKTRIGVHRGQTHCGFVGDRAKLYDALGEAMARAARLKSIADADEIVVSDFLCEGQHGFAFGTLESVQLGDIKSEARVRSLLGRVR